MSVSTIDSATFGSRRGGTFLSDPWEAASLDIERRDSWLLSYIDILTLFLTLLVMLLALEPDDEALLTEPRTEVTQGDETPLMESVAAVVAELIIPSPLSTPWPEIVPLPETDEPTGETPPAAQSPVVKKPEPEKMALLEEIDTEPVPEAPQMADSVSDQAMASVDRVMERLTTAGLSERLRAKKVAQGVRLEVNDNILFDPGSAELKSEGQRLLDELTKMFIAHEGGISIEGHTDDRPIASARFPSNWELSSGRATVVARYLIDQGYDPAHLRAVGYADTQPLATNDTPEGRARNRRVSVTVRFSENKELTAQ